MRMGYKCDLVTDDNGKVCGIILGNGGCAEHERGIGELLSKFNVNSDILGIDGRKINDIPDDLVFLKYKSSNIKRALFGFDFLPYELKTDDVSGIKKYLKKTYELHTKTYSGETNWLSVAWSNRDFAIYGAGDEEVFAIETIHKAFIEKDIVMYVGGDNKNPFDRGGLVFLIYSLLDEDFKNEVLKMDTDDKLIKEKSKPILNLLKEKKCEFHGCRPDWVDETKTKLRYFLNPSNQDNNYWGWVSEQDLIDWTNGEGVIPGHGRKFEKEYPEQYKELQEKTKNNVGLY